MDQDRTLPRDRLITQLIFLVVIQNEWQGKTDRKTIRIKEQILINKWGTQVSCSLLANQQNGLTSFDWMWLHVSFCYKKDTALSSSFSRDIVNVRKEIAWRTEYFMRNETLLFGLLSYHVKNVVWMWSFPFISYRMKICSRLFRKSIKSIIF